MGFCNTCGNERYLRITGADGETIENCPDCNPPENQLDPSLESRAADVTNAGAAGGYSQAITDIIAERQRQITEKGYTLDTDDIYTRHELSRGAMGYIAAYQMPDLVDCLLGTSDAAIRNKLEDLIRYFWPQRWPMTLLGPQEKRRMLIKAAALLIADIERGDRADG